MFNIKALFLRAMLALSIALGAPAAMAGPTYHVSINTSSLSGSGFLSLGLLGYDNSGPFDAFASNFSGDFVGTGTPNDDASGDVVDGVRIGNRGWMNLFDQGVNFGGLFSFDVRFDGDLGAAGSLFSVTLLDEFLGSINGMGNLVEIDFAPGEPVAVAVLEPLLADATRLAEVPEPADWLLLATGLMLIAMTRRMQQRG